MYVANIPIEAGKSFSKSISLWSNYKVGIHHYYLGIIDLGTFFSRFFKGDFLLFTILQITIQEIILICLCVSVIFTVLQLS